jgi:hypothetical protein
MYKTNNLAHLSCDLPGRFFRRGGLARLRGLVALATIVLVASAPAILRSAKAQKEKSLFSRFEEAMSVKEPQWKLVTKNERIGAINKYFTQDWMLGDEYVSTTTYEMTSPEEAAVSLIEFIRSPVSVPVRITQVPGLGTEAYTIGDAQYGRKGSGTLAVRRGKYMIRLDASSLTVAQRFAEHMVVEIDSMSPVGR